MACGKIAPQENLKAQLDMLVKRAIVEAQIKLETEARKQVMILLSKLPTPQELLEKLNSALCTPKAMEKMEKIYNKIEKTLSWILEKLDSVKNFLNKILTKIQDIMTKVLSKIQKVTEALQPTIKILDKILLAAPIALGAMVGLAANGAVIQKLANAIDTASEVICVFKKIINWITKFITKYTEKAQKILNIIQQAYNAVSQLYDKVDQIRMYLEFLYLAYVQSCLEDPIPECEEYDDEGNCIDDGWPPEEETLIEITSDDILDPNNNFSHLGNSTPDLLSAALQNYVNELNLMDPPYRRVAERIYAMKFNHISLKMEVAHLKEYKLVLKPNDGAILKNYFNVGPTDLIYEGGPVNPNAFNEHGYLF